MIEQVLRDILPILAKLGIPYILTGGAGMYLGIVAWRRRNDASVRSRLTLRIPGEAIRDVGWIWALALPIFLAGSLFEFLQ